MRKIFCFISFLFFCFLTQVNQAFEDSDLHSAIAQGDKVLFDQLIANKVYVNGKNSKGFTPLHIAAFYNRPKMIQVLMDSEARIDIRSRKGNIPFHLAAVRNHLEVAQQIASDESTMDLKTFDILKSGIPSKSLVEDLLADDNDKIKLVSALINQTNNDGNTPLHLAAQYNSQEVAQFLIQNKAYIDSQNTKGNTPLHLAAQYNSQEVAQILIDHDASVDMVNKDRFKQGILSTPLFTPLHVAVMNNSLDVAQILIDGGADIDEGVDAYINFNNRSKTLIGVGAVASLIGMVDDTDNEHNRSRDFLVGASIVLKDHKWSDYTPLHLAVHSGHLPMIQLLLSNGADVNAKDDIGYTPLHVATQHNRMEVADLLLEYGANVNAQASPIWLNSNPSKYTPLHLAIQNQNFEMCKLFLESGANVHLKFWLHGLTSLELAQKYENRNIINILKQYQNSY